MTKGDQLQFIEDTVRRRIFQQTVGEAREMTPEDD
jgi:hypothetical protein